MGKIKCHVVSFSITCTQLFDINIKYVKEKYQRIQSSKSIIDDP